MKKMLNKKKKNFYGFNKNNNSKFSIKIWYKYNWILKEERL